MIPLVDRIWTELGLRASTEPEISAIGQAGQRLIVAPPVPIAIEILELPQKAGYVFSCLLSYGMPEAVFPPGEHRAELTYTEHGQDDVIVEIHMNRQAAEARLKQLQQPPP